MEENELVKAIVGYRTRNHLSIKAFAEKVNITPNAMQLIESGKTKKPQRTTIYKIKEILDSEVL